MATEKVYLTGEDILERVLHHPELQRYSMQGTTIYGVPRGGVPVALLAAALHGFKVVERLEEAQLIVDDLIDSGATAEKFAHTSKLFVALYDKRLPTDPTHGKWVVFPWEETLEKDMGDHAARLLQGLGKNATPQRIITLMEFVETLE